MPKGHFVSCFKERKMIFESCIYHLFWVRDRDSRTATLDYIPLVNEFPEVFLGDLPNFPPERKINFCTNLLLNTKPISIPPYHMALAKLKELKEQLKNLLDKGFI